MLVDVDLSFAYASSSKITRLSVPMPMTSACQDREFLKNIVKSFQLFNKFRQLNLTEREESVRLTSSYKLV